MTLTSKARGCLLGLAVGDALGQPTEGKSLEYIQKTWGRIDDFLTEQPGGSDDTEYALFSASLLLKHGLSLNASHIAGAWRVHLASQTEGFKGAGFSEMAAIENLRKGLNPPQCGEHIHSLSDGLAMRVGPFGIVAPGEPDFAARLAYEDGIVSHAGEGIFAGQAVAAAIATALTINEGQSEKWSTIVDSALGVIPRNSWTYRAITKGVEVGAIHTNVWDALQPLNREIVCDYYYWSDLAPEAVGLAFGLIAASQGDFSESVLGGVNIGRDTDTIAAIAGAITGALWGVEAIPDRWSRRISSVSGICIKAVAGMNVIETADALVSMVGGRSDEL